MIYYKLYSDAIVFDDPRLNVFFNQFYTTLMNKFGWHRVEQTLLLDGMVALLLQNETPTINQNKLLLSTADLELFNFVKNSAFLLDFSKVSFFKDEIVFELKSNHLVYFKYDPTINLSVTYRFIKVRHQSEIL